MFTGRRVSFFVPRCCSLSSAHSWRDVIRLIMLSQSTGHVHDFMSNQAAVVSMETEVAECHAKHLALMANSEAHTKHVGFLNVMNAAF